MTEGEGVGAVLLWFLRAVGPIGAVLWVIAGLATATLAYFLLMRLATRLFGVRSFDVGGGFDHHHTRILPAAEPAAITLIYAGYAALWLAQWPQHPGYGWIFRPYDYLAAGIAGAVIVGGMTLMGLLGLLSATLSALRWLRLEAIGMRWYGADSGERYRIIWVRADGKESIYDPTIRDHRLHQELTEIRKRRERLVKSMIGLAIAALLWLKGPDWTAALFPLLPIEAVKFLHEWKAQTVLSWLLFLFSMIPATTSAIVALLDELIYRTGAQFIPGAKVLDPHPERLGRADVEAQNAHGDADFVSAEEAVQRMGGQAEL